MVLNLAKDWPAYIMLGSMIAFFIYVIIKGNLPEDEDKWENKKEQNKGQDKSKSLKR